jgi:hypothetical protein
MRGGAYLDTLETTRRKYYLKYPLLFEKELMEYENKLNKSFTILTYWSFLPQYLLNERETLLDMLRNVIKKKHEKNQIFFNGSLSQEVKSLKLELDKMYESWAYKVLQNKDEAEIKLYTQMQLERQEQVTNTREIKQLMKREMGFK